MASDRQIGLAVTVDPQQAETISLSSTSVSSASSASGVVMPTKIGRFAILRQLGAGGMGVVYLAFDEVLERQVALKLVHGGTQSTEHQTRMMREAQALARLSHPNVVQIYEVGEHNSEVYIAMELVKGQTLAAWIEAFHSGESADFDAVVETLLAAGEGLAAAHRVGVVHRDFKPANVLVGDDGRVRVLDFGLAASASGGAKQPLLGTTDDQAASSAFQTELTQAGTILGTPAYMAPEQLAGGEIDFRADIFAFSVTLHEALHGVRPFVGSTIVELLNNIHAQKREALPGRRGPSWLKRTLEKGLAADPDERWQTMPDYLEALRNSPAKRRRKVRWVLASLCVPAILCALIFGYPIFTDYACQGAGEQIHHSWNDDIRDTLAHAFVASGSPHADATWARADARIEAWSQRWEKEQQQACMGETAVDVDLQARCLEQQIWQLDGLLQAFETVDKDLVNRVISVVAELPKPSRCSDPRWLLHLDLTADGKDKVYEQELLRLRAALATGRFQYVRKALAGLIPKLPQGSRLYAEALLLDGRAARRTGEHNDAQEQLKEAFFLSGASGHEQLAAAAAIGLTGLLGLDLDRREDGESWQQHADMMLARSGVEGELNVQLATTRGAIARRAGHLEEADRVYSQARQLTVELLGPGHPTLARLLSNQASVALERGRTREGIELLRHGRAMFIEAFGPGHPDLAVFTANLGVALINDGSLNEGLKELRAALSIDKLHLGEEHPVVGIGIFNIGTTLDESGKPAEAINMYQQSLAIMEAALGTEHTQVARVYTRLGWALTRTGKHAEGIDYLERALAIREKTEVDKEYLAVTQIYLAQAYTRRDPEDSRSRTLADAALPVLKASTGYGKVALQEYESWTRQRNAIPETSKSGQ